MNCSETRRVFQTGCKLFQAFVSGRRRRQILYSMLAVLLLGASAQAQSQAPAQDRRRGGAGDWSVVKNLMPGTRISVKTHHRYRCLVENVTDDELVCGTHAPFRSITLMIRRSEIREIRVAPHPNQAKDAWIGAGIGAGAGAVLGGTQSRDYPGFNAFVGGLAGALPGALIGGMVPIFQVVFQRGKIIYKR